LNTTFTRLLLGVKSQILTNSSSILATLVVIRLQV
jgi:hypothetical protein